MLKTVVMHSIFVKTMIYLSRNLWQIEGLKEQHLFEMEIFYNILSVFTVMFIQFNVSVLNKCINFLKKKKKPYWQPFYRSCK